MELSDLYVLYKAYQSICYLGHIGVVLVSVGLSGKGTAVIQQSAPLWKCLTIHFLSFEGVYISR